MSPRLLLLPLLALAATPAEAKRIRFAGEVWEVRPNGVGSPRNNRWCQANAFVDADGRLHLKLTQLPNGRWCSAEVHSVRRMGFGTYQWQLDGRVDTFDRNVVLGLFHYPTADVGGDATNEIDIELAKWGYPDANGLNYTIYPRRADLPNTSVNFPIALEGTATTHRYIWSPTAIRLQATDGYYDDNRHPIADWTYAPKQPQARIAQRPMPVYMNLWTIAAPTDGKPVEIVIRDFRFTPAAE